MIGIAKLVNNLYHFQDFVYFSANSVRADNEDNASAYMLWHKRLGHVAFSILPLINKALNIGLSSDSYFCDVCPPMKQHMLYFPYSRIKFASDFDKVCLDIWGPYCVHTVGFFFLFPYYC